MPATDKANVKKELASEKQVEVEKASQIIGVEKAEAEEALLEAMPALEAARLALDDLEKSDITEIRSFATPPEPVQTVCECVAIIKGVKEPGWKGAKGMMSDSGFLRSLLELNCDVITTKQVSQVRARMKLSSKLDDMKSISKAGYGLLKFVRAVLGYCDVFKDVRPKKERVQFLEAELDLQVKTLQRLTTDIAKLEAMLKDLNQQYETAMRRKQELQDKLNEAERRLAAADKLITGLSAEKRRWEVDLGVLHQQRYKTVGTCLVSAAFLAYTAAFSFAFRIDMLMNDWLQDVIDTGIPVELPYRCADQLSSDVEISQWSSEGLPPDELSVQNGILTTRASRFPLCIDPQQQALEWIKRREARFNLKVLTFGDADFLKQLEMAIMYGQPVLFQDVDDYIDPVIDNVLEKNIKSE